MGRGMADHGDFQFTDPPTFLGANGDGGHGSQGPAGRFQKVFGDFPQIRFIEGQDKRDLLFGAFQRQSFLRVADADGGVDNQEHKIGFAQDFQGFGDTQLSQLADIVETGRVDDHYRPNRQYFHRFVHRIGRGSGHSGNDGQGLVGQGVNQAGLAGVAASEQGNMETVAAWGFKHGTNPPSACWVQAA